MRWILAALFLLFTAGCSTTHYRESADREVYEILKSKAPEVPGFEPEFDIQTDPIGATLVDVKTAPDNSPALGDFAYEAPVPVISLAEALSLAVNHNRNYQTRKEGVYLAALALTAERNEFTPIFEGLVGGAYNRSTRDELRPSATTEALDGADVFIDGVEALTGNTATLLRSYQAIVEEAASGLGATAPREVIVEERDVAGSVAIDVDVLLRRGGRLAVELTSNFFRLVRGGDLETSGTVLNASFVQPLLRGAGTRVTLEALTQAERNVLYAIRDFTQFRKEFVVDVCAAYYDVLQNRDIVENNYAALANFRVSVERERALAQEGRSTAASLGRLEQAELSRENSWIESVRRYRDSLDQFKILLGLPTDTALMLDTQELKALRAAGPNQPTVNPEDAVRVALVARLDLQTARDETEDAQRRLEIAENALLPGFNVVATARVDSEDDGDFSDLDTRRARWSLGLNLDPGFERLNERNAYRRALIDVERSLRAAELAEDQVALEVREGARNLDAAMRNYEIAVRGVALNERRVEEQVLLAELGRATVLDQVDAQNDLTDAQNALTAALIRHSIARLAYWRDMGLLYIRPDGQWEEITDGIVYTEEADSVAAE